MGRGKFKGKPTGQRRFSSAADIRAAVGFKLDSLLKLNDTRVANSKMSLMHYLCKVLDSKEPVLLDFHKDLGSLELASKFHAGKNVGIGKDHTIFSLIDVLVKFEKYGPDRKKISVYPREFVPENPNSYI